VKSVRNLPVIPTTGLVDGVKVKVKLLKLLNHNRSIKQSLFLLQPQPQTLSHRQAIPCYDQIISDIAIQNKTDNFTLI
jgi:hypothetical protein